MHKQLNNHGIIELQNAIEAIVKDCITDQTIEKAQDMCEQDGGCEISARLTTSGRPEIISADDSWFDVIHDQDTIDQTQPVLCRHIDGVQLRNATIVEIMDQVDAGEYGFIQADIDGQIVDCFVQD